MPTAISTARRKARISTDLHWMFQRAADFDLLVDALPGATLLDSGDLADELKSLRGVDFDSLTPGDLPPKFRANTIIGVAHPDVRSCRALS